jgi:hypothetical protein
MSETVATAESAAGVAADVCESRRASDVLTAIAAAPDPQLSLDELVGRLGDRTFGIVLLILALLNCVPLFPGASAVLGVVMMLAALQLTIGRHQLWLPAFLRRRSIPRGGFRRAVAQVAPLLKRVERVCRPRYSWLASGPSERLIGLVVLVLAFVITLPIPVIGNIPPGVAVAILAISLLERDGLAVLAGIGMGFVAFAVNAGVVAAVAVAILEATQQFFAAS